MHTYRKTDKQNFNNHSGVPFGKLRPQAIPQAPGNFGEILPITLSLWVLHSVSQANAEKLGLYGLHSHLDCKISFSASSSY